MDNELMNANIALSKINKVKKALDDLQAGGWTTVISNGACSVFLSNELIIVRASPKDKMILSAD